MNRPTVPAASIGRVDLLLGHATMLTADDWDDIAGAVQEAMGIVLLMAATHPADPPAQIPELASLTTRDCIDRAWQEVQEWDLALTADLPDLARLRVVLADLHHGLAAGAGDRG